MRNLLSEKLKAALIFGCFLLTSWLCVDTDLRAQSNHWTQNPAVPLIDIGKNHLELKEIKGDKELIAYKVLGKTDWIEAEAKETESQIIEGLQPAGIYYLSLAYKNEEGLTDTLHHYPFVTRSESSGTFKVYFNSPVNTDLSLGFSPESTSGTVLRDAIIDKINQARYTIDVAAFNNNRVEIVDALNQAGNRGVRVRYIAEGSNANTALNRSLAFEVLKRNDDQGIMHHKFLAIDAEDSENSWTLMGSTNLTTQQIATDNNNMLFIQDQSLTRIYEMEFEEMWGSDGPVPDLSNSRFGENKRDNTPHWLMIGEIPVESYFSPSDNTAFHISNALFDAEESISFALLLFTFNPLSEVIIQKHHQGLNVRGLIHDIDANGTRYNRLKSNGVNVYANSVNGVQLHHKYALIDADEQNGTPKVITGSHNWTNRANNHNDENTLIIHSLEITNIFRQEFEARWCESVPQECFVNTSDYTVEEPFFYTYPNPSRGKVWFNMDVVDEMAPHTVMVFDNRGQLLKSKYQPASQGPIESLNLSGWPAQTYFIKYQIGSRHHIQPLIIQQ